MPPPPPVFSDCTSDCAWAPARELGGVLAVGMASEDVWRPMARVLLTALAPSDPVATAQSTCPASLRHPLVRAFLQGAQATLELLAGEQGWRGDELAQHETRLQVRLCRELKAAWAERCMGLARAAFFHRDHLMSLAAEGAQVVAEVGRQVAAQRAGPDNAAALQSLVAQVKQALTPARSGQGEAVPDKSVGAVDPQQEKQRQKEEAIRQAMALIMRGVESLSALLELPLRLMLIPGDTKLPHLHPTLEQKLRRAGLPEFPNRIPCRPPDSVCCGPLLWLARLRQQLDGLRPLIPLDARDVLLFPL